MGAAALTTGQPWFDRKLLFEAIDADQQPLIALCLSEIRRTDERGGTEKRSGDRVTFGRKGSLVVHVSGGKSGSWSDFEGAISFNGRANGQTWMLAIALGISEDEIARLYPACHRGAAPALIERTRVRAERNREKRDEESFKQANARRKPLAMSLERQEPVADQVQTYLDSRGIGHLAGDAGIKMIRRPHVVSREGEIYQLPQTCMAGSVTNDRGHVAALALTRLTEDGAKLPGKNGRNLSRQSLGPISKGYCRLGSKQSRTIILCEGKEDAGSVLHPDAWPNVRVLASIGGLRVLDDRELRGAKRIVIAADRELIKFVDPKKPLEKGKKHPTYRKLRRVVDALKRVSPAADILIAKAGHRTEGAKADLNDVLAQHGGGAVKECLDKARRVVVGRGQPLSLREGQERTQMLVMGFMGAFRHRKVLNALKNKLHADIVSDAEGFGWELDEASVKKEIGRRKRAATQRLKKQFGLKKIGGRHRLVLRITPGVGKSHSMLDGVEWLLRNLPDDQAMTIVCASSSTMLGEQHRKELLKRFPKAVSRVIYGRGNEHLPEDQHVPATLLHPGQDGSRPCPRHLAFNSLATKGLSAKKLMCGSCHLAEFCATKKQEAWLEETKGQARVLFAAHSYLALSPAQRAWKSADLVVIDENPVPATVQDHVLPLSAFNDQISLGVMVKRVDLTASLEMLSDLGKAATTLDASHLDEKKLRAFNRALQAGKRTEVTFSGLDADSLIIERADHMSGRYRSTLSAFAMFCLQHLKCKKSKLRLDRDVDAHGQDCIKWVGAKALQIANDCPVLCLDGTARQEMMQEALGEHDWVRIDVRRNIRVTQSTNTFSPSSLKNSENVEDQIVNIIKALSEIKGKFLLGANKKTLLAFKNITNGTEFEPIWKRCVTTHLGASQGSNEFEGLSTVIVVGRLSAPVHEVEAQAHAMLLALGDDRDLLTVEDYAKKHGCKPRQDGYLDQGGQPWHPDPMAEEVRRSISEDSIVQLVDRVRGVRKADQVDVKLFTNLDVEELPADNVISARRIKQEGTLTKSRFEQYAERQYPSKVAPISPALIIENAGDFYHSEKAARRDLQKFAQASDEEQAIENTEIKSAPKSISNKKGTGALLAGAISTLWQQPVEVWHCWRTSTQRTPYTIVSTLDATDNDRSRSAEGMIRWELVGTVEYRGAEPFDVTTPDPIAWPKPEQLSDDFQSKLASDILREISTAEIKPVKPRKPSSRSKAKKAPDHDIQSFGENVIPMRQNQSVDDFERAFFGEPMRASEEAGSFGCAICGEPCPSNDRSRTEAGKVAHSRCIESVRRTINAASQSEADWLSGFMSSNRSAMDDGWP